MNASSAMERAAATFRRRPLLGRSLGLGIGFVLLAGGIASCASRPYVFKNAPPVTSLGDDRPIPVPSSRGYDHGRDVFTGTVREPMVGLFDVSRVPRSGDVNSMDEVPESSWFTPRLGYREVSPEELLEGPRQAGSPRLPFTVLKAKSGGGNPGFLVQDARGERYLVKFDPPKFPAIETTTAAVVGRLFWGFGYNVPEDDLVFLRRRDLLVPPGARFDDAAVDAVLSEVAAPVDGIYRATTSRFLQGEILGPILTRGVRDDDPNDHVPHQNLRILRSLRVFGAFVNHTDMRADNSLAVYVGEKGKGHVVHYLLDFGEAFGAHGAEHERLWDGYNHIFDFADIGRNLVSLGFRLEDWEKLEFTPWPSVGAFESTVFRPEAWKETTPYPPIRRSQPADDYWAAKILGSLTREHVARLVEAAAYPDPAAAQYVIEVLMERRRKVLEFALHRVSPLEFASLEGGILRLSDRSRALLPGPHEAARYEVVFRDEDGHRIAATEATVEGSECVVASEILRAGGAHDYVRVDVRASWGRVVAPSPAEFHFRRDARGELALVGVVH